MKAISATVDLLQAVHAILDIVREHHDLTGSWPTVDQILKQLLHP